ncbi:MULTISPECIES: hypothetical protein [Aerosakkonema]|uniref:hypothetical protein n=1 Tax=Aerosakkonema TaxID=1246629 RepID=UPI0035B901C9
MSMIEQAANSVVLASASKPSATEVVDALLQAEKDARKNNFSDSFDRLIGNWRLCFITGTKKTRAKAGIVLGAGRYIPQFVKIELSYSTASVEIEEQNFEVGQIENRVTIGALKLVVSGPAKFLHKKNILAFDFTRMTVQLLGVTLFSGYIRSGEVKSKQFYHESVSKQAFFAYFFITDKAIAARGRGGGLAIWGR